VRHLDASLRDVQVHEVRESEPPSVGRPVYGRNPTKKRATEPASLPSLQPRRGSRSSSSSETVEIGRSESRFGNRTYFVCAICSIIGLPTMSSRPSSLRRTLDRRRLSPRPLQTKSSRRCALHGASSGDPDRLRMFRFMRSRVLVFAHADRETTQEPSRYRGSCATHASHAPGQALTDAVLRRVLS